MGSVPDPKTLS